MVTKESVMSNVAQKIKTKGGFWYSTVDVFGRVFTRSCASESLSKTVQMLATNGIFSGEELIAYGDDVTEISVKRVREV